MALHDSLLALVAWVVVLSSVGAAANATPQDQRCRAREPGASCVATERPVDHILLQHGARRTPPKSEVPTERALGDFCHTSQPGERCHALVAWIRRQDLAEHPQRYPGLDASASFEDVQAFLHGRGKSFCPAPCGVAPPRDAEPGGPGARPCVGGIVEMDFFGATVDADERYEIWEQPLPMRYRGLGSLGDRPFDLVVSSDSPFEDVTGGLGNGGSRFGSVIVRPGVRATVRFDFVDAETGAAVVLPKFHWSLFDLDGSPSDGWRPSVEEAYVGGFEEYALGEASEVRARQLDDGRTLFRATRIGFGCDNPVDPLRLGTVTCPFPLGHTVDQRKRAVTLLFRERSGFEATFVAEEGGGWRSFMFAGSTNLAPPCPPTPAPTPTPAPVPTPPKESEPQLGLCAVFGDPHFITFDGGHTVLFGERTLWLVRSKRVWVQGWSRQSQGRLTAIAVGGEFLQGHTLVIYKGKPGSIRVLYDGKPVLEELDSSFTVPGVVEGFHSKEWRADLHDGNILKLRTELKFDIGPWPERFQGEPKGGLILLKFPEGVELTTTGVNYMSAVLTMSPQDGGQGGYCGNFNGDADDDAEPVGPSFNLPLGTDLDPVLEAESLFKTAGAEDAIVGGSLKVEISAAKEQLDPQAALRDCKPALKARAEQRCLSVPDARMRADCVMDICMTGDEKAADDMVAADILEEKVNARGIPAFMGPGQCLDSDGRRYSGYRTAATTEKQCMELLQHLVLAKGVVGAQLRLGAQCEVLLEAGGEDPRVFEVPGGWGEHTPGRSDGVGLVSSTSGDNNWKCWHLA